jgi:hypothetical protein
VWQLYKTSFGRTIVRPKICSAEQSFGRKIVRPNNYCRKKNIRPTKFLHANRGPVHGSVRFDVYVFGRTIVRPKIISFGRKIYLVRPKICFSKIWRPDCHESVTHLRDFTQLSLQTSLCGAMSLWTSRPLAISAQFDAFSLMLLQSVWQVGGC